MFNLAFEQYHNEKSSIKRMQMLQEVIYGSLANLLKKRTLTIRFNRLKLSALRAPTTTLSSTTIHRRTPVDSKVSSNDQAFFWRENWSPTFRRLSRLKPTSSCQTARIVRAPANTSQLLVDPQQHFALGKYDLVWYLGSSCFESDEQK